MAIISDFKDYYDEVYNSISSLDYIRNYGDCQDRSEDLRFLRSLGISTIDVKAIRDFDDTIDQVVVYLNPRKHNGEGKTVLDINTAKMLYWNQLGSFYYKDNTSVLKLLHIGKRRFQVLYRTRDSDLLSRGIIHSVYEIDESYNYMISEPIFSIDFIVVDGEMIAIDFNKVQSLSEAGFFETIRCKELKINKPITKKDICKEVEEALIKYNKT